MFLLDKAISETKKTNKQTDLYLSVGSGGADGMVTLR